MQTGYPYQFTTGTELAAEITMTLDPALPKWGQPFTANVHVTGEERAIQYQLTGEMVPLPTKYSRSF